MPSTHQWTDNPNAADNRGVTPIHCAADQYWSTEIGKFLAPLTDNPNAPNDDGDTPIRWAAWNGPVSYTHLTLPTILLV